MKSAIRFAAETEMQMNAIERVKEYTSVPNENYLGLYCIFPMRVSFY